MVTLTIAFGCTGLAKFQRQFTDEQHGDREAGEVSFSQFAATSITRDAVELCRCRRALGDQSSHGTARKPTKISAPTPLDRSSVMYNADQLVKHTRKGKPDGFETVTDTYEFQPEFKNGQISKVVV
jgi:hypothetical protein